ncbi:14886_t:CDS:2, partial [Dentiscutata erythropus]
MTKLSGHFDRGADEFGPGIRINFEHMELKELTFILGDKNVAYIFFTHLR